MFTGSPQRCLRGTTRFNTAFTMTTSVMSGLRRKIVWSRSASISRILAQHSSKGRSAVAKGQKRSSREIRKPKQVKAPLKPEGAFGAQIKLAEANAPRGKGKS